MSTYVLIHGSWHGAWCWYKIIPLLEQVGHKAITLDLPGHGRDGMNPTSAASAQITVGWNAPALTGYAHRWAA